MTRRIIMAGILSITGSILLVGCRSGGTAGADPASSEDAIVSEAAGRVAELNHGYAILLQVLNDQARASQVLAVKSASPGLRTLLKRISAAARAQVDEIERMLSLAPPLAPTNTTLPSIEVAARDRIEEEQTSQLLTTGGDAFAFDVLVAQARATTYASALATSLGNRDTNAKRRDVCKAIARDWNMLGKTVRSQLRAIGDPSGTARKTRPVVPGTPSP